MSTLPPTISRLTGDPELLRRLCPKEPLDFAMVRELRAMDDATLAPGVTLVDRGAWALVRGGVLYGLDALEAAHGAFQDDPSPLGSYWHGMLHRREADFDNARYWFRRAGRLPFFARLHGEASRHSALMARQGSWDPYVFTGECEQAKFGAEEGLAELLELQRAEWLTVLEYSWRQATGAVAEG